MKINRYMRLLLWLFMICFIITLATVKSFEQPPTEEEEDAFATLNTPNEINEPIPIDASGNQQIPATHYRTDETTMSLIPAGYARKQGSDQTLIPVPTQQPIPPSLQHYNPDNVDLTYHDILKNGDLYNNVNKIDVEARDLSGNLITYSRVSAQGSPYYYNSASHFLAYGSSGYVPSYEESVLLRGE
ncbi:MAG: hypothetical protein NTV32_10845 [Gammaproteobacteria bacterium]|nr:hypothetical protein [Gammaproteobacteria bacterium]